MFNTHLKQRLISLQDELSTTYQLKESIYSEMLVMEFSPAGEVVFTNDNMLLALGHTRERLLGRPLDSLIPSSFHSHPNHPVLMRALREQNTGAGPSACSKAMARKPGFGRFGSQSRTPEPNCSASPCAPAT